jgi:ferredoxin
LRCAACSTLAPELFALRAASAEVIARPSSDDERDRGMAALLICPAQAIGVLTSEGA